MTYDEYVAQMQNLMVIQYSSDASFQTFLPGCISYAEDRINREADLLATRVVSSGKFTANQRTFAYPVPTAGSYLVIEEINAITPVLASASSGVRQPLQVASKQFLDFVYPGNYDATGVPSYFFPLTSSACLIGPVPDAAYDVEVIGTVYPTPLSSGNPTTWVSVNLPDLLIAASMVYASGYMRDFGAQTDNPQMSESWESQYNKLFASAMTQELRKKYASQAWQSEVPNPVATPPRA